MKFCSNPFNSLHVGVDGYITCCGEWFTDPSEIAVQGAEAMDDLWRVWNHEKFQKLRRAWLNQDNYLCKRCVLPLLKNDDAKLESYMTPVMSRGPSVIVFSNDLTCNLHCWSCRSKPIIEKRQKEIFRQTENVLNTFKDSIRFISAIGSGDPLASPAWRNILQTLDVKKYNKDLQIELFTNGLLIPEYWDSLSHLHNNITTIKMSVDAASKEIYEKTRLGGKFEKMDKAMKFISKLDKNFVLNMVIESDNFTDIPLFIERAIDHNASWVNLTMLRNWPDIRGGEAVFREKNLANPKHPKREQFLKLLQNNEDLLSHPIVDASRIRPEGHKLIQQ